MKKNIFLKGEKGIGKTYIINSILAEFEKNNIHNIGGFRTISFFYDDNKDKRFVHIVESKYILKSMHHNEVFTDAEKNELLKYINKDNLVGTCEGSKSRSSFDTSAFENYGTNLLLNDINKKDFFVFDEIGFFESEAKKFLSTIKSILDSEVRVLGVIKRDRDIDFINDLYDREDTDIIEITLDNRDKILEDLKTELL